MVCTLRTGLAVGLAACCIKRSLTAIPSLVCARAAAGADKWHNQGQSVSTAECREAGRMAERVWLEI